MAGPACLHPTNFGTPLTRFVAPQGAPPKTVSTTAVLTTGMAFMPPRCQWERGALPMSRGALPPLLVVCLPPSFVSYPSRYSQLHMVGSFARLIFFRMWKDSGLSGASFGWFRGHLKPYWGGAGASWRHVANYIEPCSDTLSDTERSWGPSWAL